jgi:hypothetical protein
MAKFLAAFFVASHDEQFVLKDEREGKGRKREKERESEREREIEVNCLPAWLS